MQETVLTDFSEYSRRALATARYPNIGDNYVYPTLGLAGEAGEVADKVKKVIRDNNGVMSDAKKLEIYKELGDVLWYVSQIAWELNTTLRYIAELNLEKLEKRAVENKIGGSGDNR